jgi:hypothetical protein
VSRARLDSLRDTASQLRYAARSWYTAAGAPAVNGLAAKATDAVRGARSSQAQPAALEVSRTADIHVLLSAQSIGWYGPLRPAAGVTDQGEEEGDATGQSDRLAS